MALNASHHFASEGRSVTLFAGHPSDYVGGPSKDTELKGYSVIIVSFLGPNTRERRRYRFLNRRRSDVAAIFGWKRIVSHATHAIWWEACRPNIDQRELWNEGTNTISYRTVVHKMLRTIISQVKFKLCDALQIAILCGTTSGCLCS